MADAIVSAVAERIIGLIEEQARYHVNLVRGAEEEVRCLAKELNIVRNVLDDAENRRFKDKIVKDWLVRLEQTSYAMEDALDEWNYAILKLKQHARYHDQSAVAPPKQKVWSFFPSSPCLCFKKVVVRHDIARKILDVKKQLDEVLREKDRYNFVMCQPSTSKSWRDASTSFTDLAKVQGRDRDRDVLVSKLMANGDHRKEELGIHILSIVGVGGLGKTTLAQLVYNDSRVEKSFDLRIWVCVSDPFEVAMIAKSILESVGMGSSSNTTQLDALLKNVSESISGKKFLLVLDDVWTQDSNKWEPLKNSLSCGRAGSMILVTTRNERVAKIMGTVDDDIHRPGALSHEDCWLVMCCIALSGKNIVEFEEIGKKIAKKCNGLPLAAKTLGSLLRFKNTLDEWENVLNSEIWQLEEVEVDLFPHLLLSYNELSPTLKRCFSYCAVFPKDYVIDVEELIGLFMALGYLGSEGDIEGRGREYFDILATQSLFQDFVCDLDGKIIKCKMHDIIYDFVQFIRKSGRVEAAGISMIACQSSDYSLLFSFHVKDFLSLFGDAKESLPNFCHCLRLRVLDLGYYGLRSLPQGIENLIHLRWLNLFGINIFSRDDLKIIFQLYNLQTLRLVGCGEIPSEIGKLINLRHLNLSGNETLKELPMEIGNLIHLRHLDLSWNETLKELPMEIGNLVYLRHLNLSCNMSIKELPREIGNLIQLRHLNLSTNKSLRKLPREIGNLIHLRELDLRYNESLEVLPSEIGNLIRLRRLDLRMSESLKELPESICGLHELRTLNVSICPVIHPYYFDQLHLPISLCTMSRFNGGYGENKLGLLKNLNHLTGSLMLYITLGSDDLEAVVKDAREAELRNKILIEGLVITFEDDILDENEKWSSVRMDVLDALEPHPNLHELKIEKYRGSKLPEGWIVSPLNQVRKVCLCSCSNQLSLPPLGKLPCLEELVIEFMLDFQFLGPEFLAITSDMRIEPSSSVAVAFPKLKTLRFSGCHIWKEWEDITAEEEESAALSLMPCLTHLVIDECFCLTALPHRLLRKAASLQVLNIRHSTGLEHYGDEDGPDWKSISRNNPALQLEMPLLQDFSDFPMT